MEAIWSALLVFALLTTATEVGAEECPTNADQIATDRPDTTNSSLVVPYGSLQAENGVDWTVRHGSNALAGTNTRLRLGVAHCTEFLIDVPTYFWSLNGSQRSGFTDVVVSFKRQLPVPFGLAPLCEKPNARGAPQFCCLYPCVYPVTFFVLYFAMAKLRSSYSSHLPSVEVRRRWRALA
jgi:hypothetical protein